MPQKSLCFFNTNIPWGGGEHWHFETALLARDKGYRVCVVAAKGSVLAHRLNGQKGISLFTVELGALSFLNPCAMLRLVSLFRQQQVDTVVLCLPRDVKAGGVAAKLAGVRDIIYRRGIAVPVQDSLFNRLLYRHMLTKLIVNSEETRRCVLSENKQLVPRERIHLIYNGFDIAAFDARQSTALEPRKPGEIVIGTAGRLTAQKGQHLLLEAAALLRAEAPPFRVLIAGTGELDTELKAQAQRLGLHDCVEFLGFVTDMKAFHQSLDIFALPSLWEGFGFVLAEAMSMRLPVAAFNVSSIPEVVADNSTGLLSAPDAGLLARNLLRLMRDERLRTTLGTQGRARVLAHFEVHKTFADLEACLDA